MSTDPREAARRMADDLMADLKQLVEADALQTPMVFTVVNGRKTAITLAFESPADKHALCRKLGILLRRKGATSAVFAAESWMAPATPEGPDALPPSQHPGRREGLVVVAMAAGTGWAEARIHPFTRDAKDRATWGPAEERHEAGSLAVHLFSSYIDRGH